MVRNLKKLLRPYRKYYFWGIAATFLSAVISLSNPLIIRFVIDNVLGGEDPGSNNIIAGALNFFHISFNRDNIGFFALLVLSVSVLSGIFSYFRITLSAKAAEEIAKDQKDMLYDHIQKLPYDYHVKAQTGDLIQRCTSDVDTVRRFLSSQFIEIFRIIFVAVIVITILINLSVKLTLVTVIFIPFIFYFSYSFLLQIRSSFNLADIKEGELSTVLQENLTGTRVVKAFGMEAYELDKFQEKNTELRDLTYKPLHQLAVYWGTSDFMCFTQIALVLIAGTYMAFKGDISVGTILVFAIYVNNLVWPLRQLGRILSQFGKMEVSLGRINEILIAKEEEDTENPLAPSLKGDIVFDNVTFGYERNKPVLKNVSFTVKKGETIAILGPTSSGKSSLMHLFLRLYDYNEGSIKINGIELKEIEKKYLRSKIGIVLQEPFLYSKTIMENIKMAKDEVAEEEAYLAAESANIHHVIKEFKDGYATMVGERGVTLSGGQKQRLAIARTLVRDNDILIFDDSLSAVDTQTDAYIRKSLKEKSKGITTFIISQRITTLMDADRIFVIEGGRLTNIGTHDDLIKKEGLYKRIWDIQNMMEEDFLKEA